MTYAGNCRLGDLFENRREKGRPGLPLLSVTMNDGLVDREDLDRKQDTTLSPEEHLLVKPGDIAYNMMRMWQGAFGLADREGLVSPAYVVLKPKRAVNPVFATHLLRTPRLRYLLWAFSYGITDDRLRLYFDDFAAIPAYVPDLGTQTAVASVLSCWDGAIAKLRRLIEVREREKRALMRQFLSPHRTSQWRQSGWRRLPMAEIAEIDKLTLPSNTPGDFRFRYVSLADVDEGAITAHLEVVSYSNAPSRARRVVRPGDVLMATVRPNLRSYALASDEHRGCIASTGFALLTCSDEVMPAYVHQYLFSDDIQQQINSLVAGSNYPAIGSSDVADLLLNVPDMATQERLVRALVMHDAQTTQLRKYVRILLNEKIAIEQRLFGALPKRAVATPSDSDRSPP